MAARRPPPPSEKHALPTYDGRASVTMSGSNVPLMISVIVDDPGRPDWNGLVQAADDGGDGLREARVHVVLLDAPEAGQAASADVITTPSGAVVLRGVSAFDPLPGGPVAR